jgi:hypothetical protein
LWGELRLQGQGQGRAGAEDSAYTAQRRRAAGLCSGMVRVACCTAAAPLVQMWCYLLMLVVNVKPMSCIHTKAGGPLSQFCVVRLTLFASLLCAAHVGMRASGRPTIALARAPCCMQTATCTRASGQKTNAAVWGCCGYQAETCTMVTGLMTRRRDQVLHLHMLEHCAWVFGNLSSHASTYVHA